MQEEKERGKKTERRAAKRRDTNDPHGARRCSERGNSPVRGGRVNFSLIDRPDTRSSCTSAGART